MFYELTLRSRPFNLIRSTLGAVTATALLSVCGAASAQTKWQMPSGYSAETFQTRNLAQFANDVWASSEGKLEITLHPNNSLVKMSAIPSKVRDGSIAAGEVIMSTLTQELPIAGADSVPFIVHSFEDARRLWKIQRPLLDNALRAKGMIALYAVPWPPQGLYSVKAVRDPRDFQGLKMRTYNPTTVRIAQLLGAQGVDVPFPAVQQALAEGSIDTMVTSTTTGVDSKAWTRMRFYSDIKAWFPKNVVLVNLAAFNALDQKTRDTVLAAAARAEERGWEMSQVAAERGGQELASHGMKVEPVAFRLRTELRRYGEKFSLEWIRATGRDAADLLIPYFSAIDAEPQKLRLPAQVASSK